jgi:uncharacterized protein YacL
VVDYILVRALFVLIFGVSAAWLRPPGVELVPAILAGMGIALLAILLESRLHRLSLQRVIGIAFGVVIGLFCSALLSLVLSRIENSGAAHIIQIVSMLLFVYFGAVTGAVKGDLLNLGALGGVFGSPEAAMPENRKILDTSVIIDGRIADIAETGFLDGRLIVPQFVLHELQMVADSADGMKRNRGRRGLDILQRMQKMPNSQIEIVQDDFPQLREVDMKLIELAKSYTAAIVTNDFNLNKVAGVRGVQVLNINDLANSLRPIVLPGEIMRVFILKEGKEYNQGVAYLDDGTMVVVDNARRMISRNVDIVVTSVLQTAAGKMIFGKFDERAQALSGERAAAATATPAPAGAERRPDPALRQEQAARQEQAVGET